MTHDERLVLFRAYLQSASIKQAAYRYGYSPQTVKNALSALYADLDVHSAVEAAARLGWLKFPPLDVHRCGLAGTCRLPHGHRGPHKVEA
jgi:hypothetical protein